MVKIAMCEWKTLRKIRRHILLVSILKFLKLDFMNKISKNWKTGQRKDNDVRGATSSNFEECVWKEGYTHSDKVFRKMLRELLQEFRNSYL